MLSVAFVGVALAACGLPATIDPTGECVTDAKGWSTLDADSDAGIPISLTISTKDATTDAFRVVHPATAGALDDNTADDGRYILACKQVKGFKTVMMTVSRPADLTAFGGEWVQLFPKDSWANTTNEYEPFTFNHYGAKIPLPEFRATPTGLRGDGDNADGSDGEGLSQQSADGTTTEIAGTVGPSADAATSSDVNVYMEVSDEGDYEVMYGNPGLQSGGKWVAVQFRSTLLRVGTPWAVCSDGAVLGASTYDVGSIMPILFGGPNVNSIALRAGFPSYLDVISELQGVSVPVKVVLEVFNADKKTYTDSAGDGQCYRAGNTCPEAHLVCKPEYCEMDVWAAIIADFKAASPGKVTVLGSIDSSTTVSEYDDLDMDGFYFVGTDVQTRHYRRALTSPLAGNLKTEYDDNCLDYDFNDANGNVYMYGCHGGDNQQWVFTAAGELKTQRDDKCLDYNYNTGNVYMHGCHGGTNQKWHINPDGTMGTSRDSKCLDYNYDNMNVYMHDCHSGPNQLWVHPQRTANAAYAAKVTVSAIGAPLFDESAVAGADVYVTLASSDIGLWNPFSWYPYVSPSKWAAMVTEATGTSTIATLFDRGYGWVYLTSEAGFATKSTMTPAVLDAIEAVATTRRLQGRRLQASEPFWGCDDTLFECQPICMKQMGTVTLKVSKTLCAEAPMDQCTCKCFHEAQWTCEGESVVCKARFGAGDLETVGEKVCEIRGAPKPASTAELRIASECEPMTDMRGSSPTEDCLAQWSATPEPQAKWADLLDESFAASLALAALAFYA